MCLFSFVEIPLVFPDGESMDPSSDWAAPSEAWVNHEELPVVEDPPAAAPPAAAPPAQVEVPPEAAKVQQSLGGWGDCEHHSLLLEKVHAHSWGSMFCVSLAFHKPKTRKSFVALDIVDLNLWDSSTS